MKKPIQSLKKLLDSKDFMVIENSHLIKGTGLERTRVYDSEGNHTSTEWDDIPDQVPSVPQKIG